MLNLLLVLLLLAWVGGFAFDVAGNLVHVLLVVAAVVFLARFFTGRSTV